MSRRRPLVSLLLLVALLALLSAGCQERRPDEPPHQSDETTVARPAPEPEEPAAPAVDPALEAARRTALVARAREGMAQGGLQASLTAPLPVLEPRGPRVRARPPRCGTWPALEPASAARHAEVARYLPDAALVGAIRSDRAIVQTRLATVPGRLRVVYQAGPDCEAQRTRSVSVSDPLDGTARIALTDLEPDTTYRYRVEVDGAGEGLWGSFTTAPVESDDVEARIAFGADIFTEGTSKALAILPSLSRVDADVYLNLGDWPYADAAPSAKTLQEYRGKHRHSRSIDSVRELMRSTGILAIWDDHEVTNDWDGRDNRREPERVAAAVQAWHEYFPTEPAPESLAQTPPGIFRQLRWGAGVELFLLDTRAFRDANNKPDGPDKTMLGAAQLEWLLAALESSTATFKVIVSSVPLVQATTRDDAWDGFRHERDELLGAITARGLEGVVVISGDQHWLAVHHTHHGFKEFQVGPTAAFLREPRPGPPAWVRTQRSELNFGILDYTPASPDGAPPRLRFRSIGKDDRVLYDEDAPLAHGRLTIETDSPLVGWQLDGPHTFAGHGSARLERVPVGTYRITWHAPLVLDEDPAAVARVVVSADGESQIVNRARPTVEPLAYSFFDALGSGDSLSWRVFDQGRVGGSSRWREVGDAMGQFSSIRHVDKVPKQRGTRPDALLRAGTMLVSEQSFGDFTLTARMLAGDEDGWGIVWDVDGEGGTSYHRIDFDGARGGWRLLSVVEGKPTLLAEDLGYAPVQGRWVDVTVERRGDEHCVVVDGEGLVTVTSPAPSGGGLGFYSWAMSDLRIDDVVVMP